MKDLQINKIDFKKVNLWINIALGLIPIAVAIILLNIGTDNYGDVYYTLIRISADSLPIVGSAFFVYHFFKKSGVSYIFISIVNILIFAFKEDLNVVLLISVFNAIVSTYLLLKGSGVKKFHIFLNMLIFVWMAFFYFVFDAFNLRRTLSSNYDNSWVFLISMFAILVTVLFGIFSLFYHLTRRNEWAYIFLSLIDMSWIAVVIFWTGTLAEDPFYLYSGLVVASVGFCLSFYNVLINDCGGMKEKSVSKKSNLLLILIIAGLLGDVGTVMFRLPIMVFSFWTVIGFIVIIAVDIASVIGVMQWKKWAACLYIGIKTASMLIFFSVITAFPFKLLPSYHLNFILLPLFILSLALTLLTIKLIVERWKHFE